MVIPVVYLSSGGAGASLAKTKINAGSKVKVTAMATLEQVLVTA